jgi:hypothetical protein
MTNWSDIYSAVAVIQTKSRSLASASERGFATKVARDSGAAQLWASLPAVVRRYTQFSDGRPRDGGVSRRSSRVTAIISGSEFQLVIIFRRREGIADRLGGTTLEGSQFAITDFAL